MSEDVDALIRRLEFEEQVCEKIRQGFDKVFGPGTKVRIIPQGESWARDDRLTPRERLWRNSRKDHH